MFQPAVRELLLREGSGLVGDDHGRGPSRYGITLATARERYPNCSPADIERLGPETAALFYRAEFWQRYHLGLLENQEVANKMLDLAVNCGGATAIKILQRACGVDDDGILGALTAAAANARRPEVLLAAIRGEGKQHYLNIVTAHPDWAEDLPGWLNRLAR